MGFVEKYGPWALIAGASDGVGLAFARRLAREGMKLILVARNQAKLDSAAEEVKALGAECITVSADLSRRDGTDKAIAAAGDREVGLVVTNCGADSINSKFLDADISEWQGLAEMNVGTKMRLAHHFCRQMRERGAAGDHHAPDLPGCHPVRHPAADRARGRDRLPDARARAVHRLPGLRGGGTTRKGGVDSTPPSAVHGVGRSGGGSVRLG